MSIERIDFHSHILPGADHGCSDVETAVKQVALLRGSGIGTIVATPHFYPEQTSVKDFLLIRSICAEQLKNALPAGAPTIHLGAEVLICPDMDQLPDIEKLCIEGTNTLLLEMPFTHFSDKILYTVENMSKLDINIVMAHIDRYDPEDVEELMCNPVLAQVNAASLIHRKVRKNLEQYFIAGRVVALGTDLHRLDTENMKNYEKGLGKIGPFNEKQIYGVTRKLISGAKAL